LVIANAEGSGPPLLCVHGFNGEAVYPKKLAEELGNRRPTYGFRALGLGAGERPLPTVEQIARNYLAALTRVRNAGPFLVLGHCAGSIIAYEMAQQLTTANDPPAGLILIDPPAHRTLAPFLFASGLSLVLEQTQLNKKAEARPAIEEGADLTPTSRRKAVRDSIGSAVGAYTPTPYAGKTLLFYTPERREATLNADRGYPRLLGDYVTVAIPSSHREMFSKHMPEIAAAMASFLDRVAPLTPPPGGV
jgi:thioesterase domain-containing protein